MTDVHLATGQLIRALDDELTASESAQIESHLDTCDACRVKLRELGATSSDIENALLRPIPVALPDLVRRDGLLEEMRAREQRRPGQPSRMWYSGIAAGALAAGLLLVLFTPSHISVVPTWTASSNSTLQVNGESFVALPFSNGDLAAITPRIVEMQLPAASLAEAGVVFEPISTAASDPDRSVRADVLLGADGEPLGVHVLGQ